MAGGGKAGGGGIDDSALLGQIFNTNATRMSDFYKNLGLPGSTMEQQDISTSPLSIANQTQALGGQLQPEIQQANLQQQGQTLNQLGSAGSALGSIAGAGLGL